MDMQPDGIATAEIDRALERGTTSFRLTDAIERLYRQDAVTEQRTSVALNMVAFLCLFDSFIVNDYFMLRDDFSIYLVGKFLVVTPVCLISVLLLRREASYQFALCLFSVTLTGTLSVMLYLSIGAYRGNYLFGDLLIMVGTIALTRPRVSYAFSAILVQCACFEMVVLTTDIVPAEGRIVSSLFCMSGGIIAAFTAYALENVNRRAFLLKLRVQLLNRDLQAVAVTDPLTGLGNRRALEEATRAHWSRPARDAAWVSLILIDIDFFKSFNDSYGHPAGDMCLERIARCVVGELRGGRDLAIRFGGEEIAVFLPDTRFAEARQLADSIRRAILAAAIPHPVVAPDAVVTASLGVASSLVGDCTPIELVKYADIALYAAKRNGRNQVWPRPAEEVVEPGWSGRPIAGLAA